MKTLMILATMSHFVLASSGCFDIGFNWDGSYQPPENYTYNYLLSFLGKKPLAPSGMIVFYVTGDSALVVKPHPAKAYNPPRLPFGGRDIRYRLEIVCDTSAVLAVADTTIGSVMFWDGFSYDDPSLSISPPLSSYYFNCFENGVVNITRSDKTAKLVSGEFVINECGTIVYGSFTDVPLDYIPRSKTSLPSSMSAEMTDTLGKQFTFAASNISVQLASEPSATILATGKSHGRIIDSTMWTDSTTKLTITWKGPVAAGTYTGNQLTASTELVNYFNYMDEIESETNGMQSVLTITSVDSTNHLMSGNFHLQLYSPGGKSFTVQNGSFKDVHW